MTTFNFDVSKKEQDGSDAIFKVNRWLLKLFAKRMRDEGMNRKKLADLLEVDKSTVSRLLRGNQNLTSRSIGEICGALGFDFDLVEQDLHCPKRNHIVTVFISNSAPDAQPPFPSGASISGPDGAGSTHIAMRTKHLSAQAIQ